MPLKIGGGVLMLLGVAVNKWTLEKFIVADGNIGSLWMLGGIVTLQIALLSFGVWMFRYKGTLQLPSRGEWALVFLALIFATAIGEVAARITRPATAQLPAYVGQYQSKPSENIADDPYMGWRLHPNHEFEQVKHGHRNVIRSNGQGFRSNRDFNPAVESMIAVVGDSFAWGSGVDYEHTFGHLLEAEISGPEVYNFAMPGFGIDQIWMSAHHYALPQYPELLVVAFIDDDFDRSLTAYRRAEGFSKPRFVLREGHLEPQTTPNPLYLALHTRSELFRLLVSQVSRLRGARSLEQWLLNVAMIEAIAAEARLADIPVLFIRLPQRYPSRFDRLGRYMDNVGLEFIDLGTPDAGLPEDMHLEYDGHLSPNGHRFVASVIRGWMTEHVPHLLASR